jgi:hypothetical protein
VGFLYDKSPYRSQISERRAKVMKIATAQMQASIAGEVTTLTQTAGLSDPHPGHLSPVSIVVTLTANTAEFFKAASSGARYRVEISREG